MQAGASMYALPGAAGGGMGYMEPTADLELSIECHGLDNLDYASKSDPVVVVHSKDASGRWRELGRTEVIQDSLDPKFATSFTIEYFFERTQWFRFDVYDVRFEPPLASFPSLFLGSLSQTAIRTG